MSASGFRISLVFWLSLWTSGCVERVDLELQPPAGQLVVEAIVSTDTSNIHRVKLSRAVAFSSVKNNNDIQDVSGADVYVSTDQGDIFDYTDSGAGNYSAQFQAEVGRDYVLHIETPDGRCYSSTVQRLLPSVPLEEIIIRYFDSSRKVQPGFYVYAKPEVRGEGGTFYRWKSHWIKQIETCFTNPILLNELRIGIESARFNEHLVGIVPFGNTSNVLFEFTQYSISEDVYQLYQLIQKQGSLEGSIFDPAQGPARSNLFNQNNPEEEVLGVFQVSDVQYGHQMIFRGRFGVRPENPVPNPVFTHPCPGPFPPPNMCPPCPTSSICPACFYGENMTIVRPNNWSND